MVRERVHHLSSFLCALPALLVCAPSTGRTRNFLFSPCGLRLSRLLRRTLGFTQRIPRINDVLAVLQQLATGGGGALRATGGKPVTLIPSFQFQQFCFFKTTYMQQLHLAGVPTLPSLFASKPDADARCDTHPCPPGWRAQGGGFSVAGGCTALARGCAACDVTAFVANRAGGTDGADGTDGAAAAAHARSWVEGGVAELVEALVPRLEALCAAAERWRAPADMGLDMNLLFVKSNQMWCREGNKLLKLTAASGQSPPPPTLREQLLETLTFMFDECGTSGVQLQPCVTALSGKRPEYRGYFVGGSLRAVAATYFRRPENDNTALGGEIMVVDLGMPAAGALLSGVPFRQMRAVMESAAAVVRDRLAMETPVMCRVDVAVDEGAQLVMLTEIEAGLDFSVFPSLIKSFDIRDACCEEICARFHAHMGMDDR